MPQLNSFADVLTDLEKLLAAAETNAELLPGLDGAKAPLVQVIADLRSLSARRDTLNADKQVLSAGLKETLQRGRDVGVEFRSFCKAHVGMRNKKLTEFRVPVRLLGISRKQGGSEGAQAARALKALGAAASAALNAPEPAETGASPTLEGGATGPA